MNQIKEVAKNRGVKIGKLNKFEPIRAIQQTEGNPASPPDRPTVAASSNVCGGRIAAEENRKFCLVDKGKPLTSVYPADIPR